MDPARRCLERHRCRPVRLGARVRRLRPAARLVDRARPRPSGARVTEFTGVRWHDEPAAMCTGSEMPDVSWFPGGTLNYAEHALAAAATRPRRRRRRRPQPDAGPDRADVGRAGRAGRRRGRGAAPVGCLRRRPCRRLRTEHPRDAGGVPRRGVARRGVGELRPRVRRAGRDRPVRPDRAGRARRHRRLSLRRPGDRPPRRGGGDRRRPSDAAPRRPRRVPRAGVAARPTLARDVARGDVVRAARRRSAGARAGPASPPTIRCTCCSARGPPASPRRSSTGTAASSPSTSRCCGCTRTSGPATASSGSRRRAG